MLSTNARQSFRAWLQTEFTRRCRRNPAYSLRAFARDLETDASTLSQILSGKRRVSAKGVRAIAHRLGAPAAQVESFLTSAGDEDFHSVPLDAFAVISDWYHYAILELTYTPHFSPEPAVLAEVFGIEVEEAREAVARLVRLGLLEQASNGQWHKTSRLITNFKPGETSGALRELQRQVISMALEAVDHVAPEDKDVTSMTMAIDPDKLPQARKLITQFRRELSAYLEDGEQTRVYQLGIQLYPVSQNLETLT